MKDLIGAYGKIAGIGAGAGFLLSLLVGLLSGNPFGIVILRALLIAVLFGGFGVGAQVMVARFLPEIAGTEGSGEEAPRRNVDILLPEENPHADFAGVRVTEPGAGGPTEDGGAEGEALAESGPAAGEGEAVELSAKLESSGSGEPSRPEPAEAVHRPQDEAAEPVTRRADAGRRRGADPLPNLDSLGSAFAAPSGGGRVGASRSRQGPGDAGDLGGEDPAVLARAIRTVLKKDEKG